jgi:hypothetical protein
MPCDAIDEIQYKRRQLPVYLIHCENPIPSIILAPGKKKKNAELARYGFAACIHIVR